MHSQIRRLTTLAALCLLLMSCASRPPLRRNQAVVRARLIEMGPAPNLLSGSIIQAFRFARYRIEQQCRGNLGAGGNEVAVAHYNGYQPEVEKLPAGHEVVLVLTNHEPVKSQGIGWDQPSGGSPEMQALLKGPGVELLAVGAPAEYRRSCRTN